MGGNIFKGKTQPIKKEHIETTVKKYFEELSTVFPKKAKHFNKEYFKYIGSVGKKAFSGDIDFAIDLSTITDKNQRMKMLEDWELDYEEVKAQFEKFKKRARTATDSDLMIRAILTGIAKVINEKTKNIYCDEKKVNSGNVFGYFPQYDENNNKLDYGVQIDWMVGNLEWLEFSYYSEVYEGNVKGLHRTQLMLAMFDNLDLSFNHTRGVIDKETREIVASTPKEAIEVLEQGYKITLSKEEFNNFFLLWKKVLNLSPYVFGNIVKIYLKILDKTRCDIPEPVQKHWVSRQSLLDLTGKFLPEDSNLRKYYGN